MTLYIEYVILDNFVIDYMLVRLVGLTFKERFGKLSIFFACAIGTISAIFLPFIYSYKFLIFIYKILTSMIMMLVLKKYKTYGLYFKNIIMFFVYTFLFGGVLIGILNIFQVEYTMSGLLLYDFEFPISIFVIILYLSYWVLKNMIKSLSSQMKTNNHLHEIKIIDKDNEVVGMGFYDSGNLIKRDGEGVNIISLGLFEKLYKDYSIEKLLFRNLDPNKLRDAKYIDIKGLSSSNQYLSFVVDKLIVDTKIIENAVMAVAIKNFKNFDCIINSNLWSDEK